MKTLITDWPGLKLTIILLSAFFALPSSASVSEKSARVGNVSVQYKVVLPDNYDPDSSYPAILAFGGGPQTMTTVDAVLERNLQSEAEQRGYIVIAPAAPGGDLFFEEGARIFPAFLQQMLQEYPIEKAKFHAAGVSNGGIAAFHVAAANPDYFLSVTAFPGYLWQPTEAKLIAIEQLCIFIYVGENDRYRWHAEMQREAEFLSARGTVARYFEEQDQPHRIDTVAGSGASRLFEGFEATKSGCNSQPKSQ